MVQCLLWLEWCSIQSLSHVWLFATPWTVAHQASLSFTISRSLLKLVSIKSVMPSNYLILCCPLLLPPSILPSIKVFSSESVLRSRWPKYWSFSFSISPSNEYSGLIIKDLDCHNKNLMILVFQIGETETKRGWITRPRTHLCPQPFLFWNLWS